MPDLEAVFAGALDRLPLAIFSHDAACITAANETMARILGRPGAAPVGVDLKYLVHPDDRAGLAELVKALAEPGRECVPVELRLLAGDTTPRQLRGHMVASAGGYLVVATEVVCEAQPADPRPPGHPDLADARTTLETLAGGDARELAELIVIVIDTLIKGADDLVAAVAADDRKQVQFHGHTLKGALRTAGMESLAALCEHLEHGATRLDVADMRTRAAEIQARCAAVVRGLAP